MRRILVVDGHPDSREALVTLCRVLGYAVEEAMSAIDALAKFGTFRPDVVVLDLPETGACDVARYIREDGDETTFLVALSASRSESERRRAFVAGCDAVMLKPGQLTQFYRLLADEKSQQRRPIR